MAGHAAAVSLSKRVLAVVDKKLASAFTDAPSELWLERAAGLRDTGIGQGKTEDALQCICACAELAMANTSIELDCCARRLLQAFQHFGVAVHPGDVALCRAMRLTHAVVQSIRGTGGGDIEYETTEVMSVERLAAEFDAWPDTQHAEPPFTIGTN